jgi:hypothetical protein
VTQFLTAPSKRGRIQAMNINDTGTIRALERAHEAARQALRRERAEQIAARPIYGTRADIEAGVADVLERRKVHRVMPS